LTRKGLNSLGGMDNLESSQPVSLMVLILIWWRPYWMMAGARALSHLLAPSQEIRVI
jgi:hypothetical protein